MDLLEKLFITEKEDSNQIIKEIKDKVEETPEIKSKIEEKIAEKEISDLLCQVSTELDINIPKNKFDAFWNTYIKEGIRTNDFLSGFYIISYFFEHYSSVDSIEGSESLYSILFYRIEKCVVDFDFERIKYPIIKTLSSVAPYAPLRCFLSPGLFDSIISLFMNHDETFEDSVKFLWRFFHREDADEGLDNVIMNLIICLSNYSPPKKSLWDFLCFFFAKFSKQIEVMCDFDALENGGLMPIFTRSLIWTVRIVIQHPSDDKNEPLFWEMLLDVLTRYSQAKSSDPVRRMYDHIFGELRLSVLYSLKTALTPDNVLIDNNALEVFKLLVKVNEKEVIESFSTMFGDIIDAMLSFSLLSENDNLIEYAKKYAESQNIKICLIK